MESDIHPAQSQQVSEHIAQAIAEANQQFSELIAVGDAAGGAKEFYTVDAVILPPGAEMVRGREPIIKFWRGAAEAGLSAAALSTVELTAAGECVHQIGQGLLTVEGKAVPATYAILWKQEDGKWKRHVDFWSTHE